MAVDQLNDKHVLNFAMTMTNDHVKYSGPITLSVTCWIVCYFHKYAMRTCLALDVWRWMFGVVVSVATQQINGNFQLIYHRLSACHN